VAVEDVVDLLIIGVQKGGMTSLLKCFDSHPQLYMPFEEQVPFFERDERVALGWEWYPDEYFGDAPAHKLWGTASPDYTADPRVPERIWSIVPDVRLVALLRDPIERAVSRYRMGVRTGYETRSFEAMVNDLPEPEAPEEGRVRPTPDNSYIVRGEYSRVLDAYYRLFPRRQMAVFFSDELRQCPNKGDEGRFRVPGAGCRFRPAQRRLIYPRGGTRRRLPCLEPVARVKILRSTWRAILPQRYYGRSVYWFLQWDTVPGHSDSPVSKSVNKRLVCHYSEDVSRSPGIIGRDVSWAVWKVG
jgi:hypothetical protein